MPLSKTQFGLAFAAASVLSLGFIIAACRNLPVEHVEEVPDDLPEPSAPPITILKRSKSTGDL